MMIAIVSAVAESSNKNDNVSPVKSDSLTSATVPVTPNEHSEGESSLGGNAASSSRPKRFFLLKKLLSGGFGGHRGGYGGYGGYGGHHGGWGGHGGYVLYFLGIYQFIHTKCLHTIWKI